MIHENSLDAYAHLVGAKKLQPKEAVVLAVFENACAALCRQQISELSGMSINGVCGRVKSLLDKGLLKVDHKEVWPATGQRVDYLIPTDKLEELLDSK